jgi:uncharacterized repeat protein (TIGR03803 family)
MKSTRTGHRWVAPLVAAVLMMLAAAIAAPAQTYSALYTFTGGADGSTPDAGLIADGGGNLYGTTLYGGNLSCGAYGCGAVFRLSAAGNEKVLHAFAGPLYGDGESPTGNLLLDSASDIYGTTSTGGNDRCSGGGGNGCGTVFRLDAKGNETLLHVFEGGVDGAAPTGGLTLDPAGNLYGTTVLGGAPDTGTIFELPSLGSEYILYSFSGSDGANPKGSLVRDEVGNLYGTTMLGGNAGCPFGESCGVVFKWGLSGETVLYSFNPADGAFPSPYLALDSAGNLYGTTSSGGATGHGTVFKVDPAGNETLLHSFSGGSDGAYPYGGVILGRDGSLYGTTSGGGAYGYGVVFALGPSGKELSLYAFTGGADGAGPISSLLLSKGVLYGTTSGGGTFGRGVVFKLSPR